MKKNHKLYFGSLIIALATIVLCAGSIPQRSPDEKTRQLELHAPNADIWKVYWGKETNGTKAGISIGYYSRQKFRYFSNASGAIPIRCFPLLCGHNANNLELLIFDLPAVESRYKLELKDDKGNLVQKTTKGEMLDKITPKAYKPSPNPLTGVTIDTGWRPARYTLIPKQPRNLEPPFLLENYFKITNSGTYHLSFELYAFKLNTNGVDSKEPILFPSVNAEIDVKLTTATN